MRLISLINKSTYEVREKALNRTIIESEKEIKELSKKLNIANIDIDLLNAEIKRLKEQEDEINLKYKNREKINLDIQNKLKNKIDTFKNYLLRK